MENFLFCLHFSPIDKKINVILGEPEESHSSSPIRVAPYRLTRAWLLQRKSIEEISHERKLT